MRRVLRKVALNPWTDVRDVLDALRHAAAGCDTAADGLSKDEELVLIYLVYNRGMGMVTAAGRP